MRTKASHRTFRAPADHANFGSLLRVSAAHAILHTSTNVPDRAAVSAQNGGPRVLGTASFYHVSTCSLPIRDGCNMLQLHGCNCTKKKQHGIL